MKAIEFINLHRNDEEEECECVIRPNGEVEEPLPSHINCLIEMTGEDSKWLHAQMDKGMEPLFWMVEFTGCMSVWQTRVVAPSRPTEEQLEVLDELRDSAMLSPKYLLQKADGAYAESVRRAKEMLAGAK